MKPDSEIRCALIGVGALLEIIWPDITGAFGDDLSQRAVGVTADEADIDRKRTAFGIPMILNDNSAALDQARPDIIFFAPPPTIGPSLVESVLKPYYDQRRAEGDRPPVLYAFPPMPLGEYYRQVLGDDILVVNIIPNNVKTIAGRKISGEGYYVCTFPSDWPQEELDRLQRVFASQGAFVVLPPDKLTVMLGGACTVFSLWAGGPLISDVLSAVGLNWSHNRIGEYMRARAQEKYGFKLEHSDPAALTAVDGPAAAFLDQVITAWHDGVARYYREVDFPQPQDQTILLRGLDSILHTVQFEDRTVLHKHSVGAATKGGVLEKAINCLGQWTEAVLRRGAAALPGQPGTDWFNDLEEALNKTAHAVGAHAKKLAG